jgi:Ca2+-binding RTX toxin-like protein
LGGTVAAPDVLSNAVFAGVSGFEVLNVDGTAATDYISFTLTDSIVNSNNASNALSLTAQDSAGIAFNGLATLDASAVTSTVALTITGGTGVDTISGGAGADEIIGGNGADTLTGSGGSDDFQVANDASMDVITDFSFGTATTSVDQIQFNANFLGSAKGTDTTADFTAAAKANNATASVDTGTIAANIDGSTDVAIITNTTYSGAAAIDTAVTALDGSIVTQDFVLVYQDTFGNVRLSLVESDGVDDQAASEIVVTDFAQLTGTTISSVSTLINSGDFIFA